MTTWTFKAILAGLALIVLAGCTEDFATLGKTGAGNQNTTVVMGGGRVALRAPPGFCIDPASVTKSGRDGFAMLARCNRLSPETAIATLSGQSPAVVTVSTKPWTLGDQPITATTIADAYPQGMVIEQRNGPVVPMVKARGGAPERSGLGKVHWRSAFVVNDQLVVLGLFAPENSRAVGSTGASLLGQLAQRTMSASRQIAVPIAATAAKE